jgi:hypothetical protein
LLLHSLESVKREICRVQGTDAWEHLLLRTFTPRLPAPAAPSPDQRHQIQARENAGKGGER